MPLDGFQSQEPFPAGWDEERVRRMIDHYETQEERQQLQKMRPHWETRRNRRAAPANQSLQTDRGPFWFSGPFSQRGPRRLSFVVSR